MAAHPFDGIMGLLTQVIADPKTKEGDLAEGKQTVASLQAALTDSKHTVASLQAALVESMQTVASLQAALAEREEKVDKLKSGDDFAKAVQAALTKYMGDAAPSGSGGKRGNPNSKPTPAPKPKRVRITASTPSQVEANSLPSPTVVPTDPLREVPPLALADAPAPFVAFNDATYRSALGPGTQGYPSL